MNGLWCHAKNKEAFSKLLENNLTTFWHQNDDYTLTSNGWIWVYPNKPLLGANSVCCMPELSINTYNPKMCGAICTDYPDLFEEEELLF